MLRDLLKNQDQSLSDRMLINALPTAVNLTTGIAKTGYRLASKFTSGVVGGLLGGGGKIARSVINRSSNMRSRRSKNPHYSSISAGRIMPVRRGDGNADIIAKLYNFMLKSYEYQKKQDELKRNFELEQREEDDRRHKELLKALRTLVKGKGKSVDSKGGGMLDFIFGMFNKIGKLISGLSGTIASLISDIPKIVSNLLNDISDFSGILSNALNGFLKKSIFTKFLTMLPGIVVPIASAVAGLYLGKYISSYLNKRPLQSNVENLPGISSDITNPRPTTGSPVDFPHLGAAQSRFGFTREIISDVESGQKNVYSIMPPGSNEPINVPLTEEEGRELGKISKSLLRYETIRENLRSGKLNIRDPANYEMRLNEEELKEEKGFHELLKKYITERFDTAPPGVLEHLNERITAQQPVENVYGDTINKARRELGIDTVPNEEDQTSSFAASTRETLSGTSLFDNPAPTPAPVTNVPPVPEEEEEEESVSESRISERIRPIISPTERPTRDLTPPDNVQGSLSGGGPNIVATNTVTKTGRPREHDASSVKVRNPRSSLGDVTMRNTIVV